VPRRPAVTTPRWICQRRRIRSAGNRATWWTT
jgi:hypothetical protein